VIRCLGYQIWIRFWKSHTIKYPLIAYWWPKLYPIEDEI
jgi:hypothetical protein